MRPYVAIFFLGFCLSTLLGGEVEPGKHARLPCKSAPEWTYDLFVPASYATETKRHFPVVFLSSPGANPGFMGLEAWAEKNGALLVAINDSKNGLSFPEITKIQDAVIKSVEATTRVHPCLRFSAGLSGAAWASMHMASRYPDSHAGVIAMAHSGNGTTFAKHIAIAFVHGDKDNVHPCSAVEAAYAGFKKKGNPARDLLVPGRGHEAAKKAETEEMLTWMLGWERLTHPKLPPDEKAAALAEIKQRMAHCAELPTAAARVEEAEQLTQLPGVDKFPEYKALAATWFSAAFEAAQGLSDPLDQHEHLMTLSEDPRVQAAPAAEQAKLAKQLAELRKRPEVKAEWEAAQVYERAAKMEAAAGKNRTAMKEAQHAYDACAKQFATTKGGKLAQTAAERLASVK